MSTLNDHLVFAIVIPQEYWQKIDKSEVICRDFAIRFTNWCYKKGVEYLGKDTYQYNDGMYLIEELLIEFEKK